MLRLMVQPGWWLGFPAPFFHLHICFEVSGAVFPFIPLDFDVEADGAVLPPTPLDFHVQAVRAALPSIPLDPHVKADGPAWLADGVSGGVRPSTHPVEVSGSEGQ